ncbi:MAG: T9SS type A sorting domain-containing protein [Bacteroidota bacterium]|nr:T9SS type A sorting domain-containing protein [Bacteroidota bacterium]
MKKTILVTLYCLFFSTLGAQQISPSVLNANGNNFSSGSAQLTFSVGEVAVTKVGNSNNAITQGFLQPKVNGVSIKENNTSVDFVVYPNPASTELNIRSSNYKNTVNVKLMDGLGRTMYNGELKNNTLSLESFPNGIYQLLLLDNEQKVMEHKTITKID